MTASERAALLGHYAGPLGFAVVPIPPGTKGPTAAGWNDPANTITTPEHAESYAQKHPRSNFGVLHAASNTAALDIDDEEAATLVFAALGLDLDKLMAANPYRIKGRRGEKPLWRIPDGLALTRHALNWPAKDGSTKPNGQPAGFTVFELRAGAVQDVLPPSTHPDTGQPYTWAGEVPASREDIPELPAELLKLWENWAALEPHLKAACPWTPQATSHPVQRARSGDGESVIFAFNDRYPVAEVLERNGYKPAGVGRWCAPDSSSGQAGVLALPAMSANGHAAVYSHHGSDVLGDGKPHDAFSAFTLLEHGGDLKAATKAAAELLGMGYKTGTAALPAPPSDDRDDDAPFPTIEGPPVLDPRALYGLAGDVVRTLDPHTEAHPAGVLVSFLTAAGAMLGNSIIMRMGGAPHALRLFVVIVGDTSSGRKGTTWHAVKEVLKRGFDGFGDRLTTGLSSGEGLIYAVRDEVIERRQVKEKGKPAGYEDVVVDAGVEDKRLIVLEDEFGRTLKAMSREGNTLSAVLRRTWEIGPDDRLSVLTKTASKATGAHVAIVGHITRGELLRYLDDVDTLNGFANRFIWVSVRRTKILPFGGAPAEADLDALAARVAEVARWAEGQDGRLSWGPCGAQAWAVVYEQLTAGGHGLAATVLGRAAPYVGRLAALYAVLDLSTEVRREHLEAALALWEYAEASTKQIFGSKSGDPVADTILAELHKVGQLSRTQIRDLFNKKAKKPELDRAVAGLVRAGVAQVQKGAQINGGRAPELLVLVGRD